MFSSRKPKLAVVPDGTAAGPPDPDARVVDPRPLAEQALDHVDELYGLARHLCATPSDAEDIVQETYARALGGATRFAAGSNLRAWLFRILRNCFIDQARRKKIVLEISDDGLDELPAHEAWDTAALDQLRYLAAGDLERALATLPHELRMIVLLDAQGFHEAEIAEIARCAPGTVKSRLFRARARLRAALQPVSSDRGEAMTDSHDSPEPGADSSSGEADRLISAALGDHLRMPAPKRLRDQLARTHLAPKRRWPGWAASAALGAIAAAALMMLVVRPPDTASSLADEAVGDHLRIIGAVHPLEVASTNIHNVKPWFTGKLEFVPPVSFVGDDEFQLRGGELAVFHGHKAAAFVYQIRLHTISLLVFPDATGQPRREATLRGFHVLSWSTGGLGMALVSDVAWEDLRALEGRLR